MKKILVLTTVAALSISPVVNAQSWWDSLKGMLGMEETTEQQAEQAPANVNGIVSEISQTLGITPAQAEQGVASILNYLKTSAEPEQFAELKASLPGVDAALASVPDVSNVESEGLMDGLLKKASEYSESIKAVNDMKMQFEAVGLKPEMIQDFVKSAESYLDTPQGQAAKDKLSEMFDSLMPKN